MILVPDEPGVVAQKKLKYKYELLEAMRKEVNFFNLTHFEIMFLFMFYFFNNRDWLEYAKKTFRIRNEDIDMEFLVTFTSTNRLD